MQTAQIYNNSEKVYFFGIVFRQKWTEGMTQEKMGHTTITYRFQLYEKYTEWFVSTTKLYNRVVAHYYGILKNRQELMILSGHELLRELERLTVGTKEMKVAGQEAEYPLEDFPKIPLYFRRAAINNAAALMRSYMSRFKTWKQQKENGKLKGHEPSQPDSFQISPLYYKGMYREWKEDAIELKLYDGEKWRWEKFRYKARELPQGAVCQSPTLVLEKRTVTMHVPVELPVCDTRTVKERMETEQEICAVSFPDYDVLAVAVLLDRQGRKLAEKSFRGGNAREKQRREILERLDKSLESRGRESHTDNAVLYSKLKKINRYYAHQISHEIVEYCVKNKIKVIVVPDYGGAIDFNDKKYLGTNAYRWQGRSIIKYLRYKAYKEGIVVTSVSSYHISDRCSECGKEIKKYNEGHHAGKKYYGGKMYICPNGHKGNTAVNTAKNVGRYFLREYQGEQALPKSAEEKTTQACIPEALSWNKGWRQ